MIRELERQVKSLEPSQRQQLRQDKARPILDAFHQWLVYQRQKVPNGSAIAKAMDTA